MKRAVLLMLVSLLATQLLFAQFSWSKFGTMEPEPAAILSGVKNNEEIDNIFTRKARGKSARYAPNQEKLLENSLYRLEFDAEKGITLIGGNLADLVFRATCIPLDLAAYEQLSDIGIEVLVNQQPMAIQATGLTAALRQIPANQIKVIEISTDSSNNPDLTGEASIVIQVTQVQ